MQDLPRPLYMRLFLSATLLSGLSAPKAPGTPSLAPLDAFVPTANPFLARPPPRFVTLMVLPKPGKHALTATLNFTGKLNDAVCECVSNTGRVAVMTHART